MEAKTLQDLTLDDIEKLEVLKAWKCIMEQLAVERQEFLEQLVPLREWENDFMSGRIYAIDGLLHMTDILKGNLELKLELKQKLEGEPDE